MEKLKKEKHNHKLTDILKVAIFSMVMLAPIFSVVSKVMYVSLNKNAYQSYSASEEFTYYEKQVAPTNDIENTHEFHEDNWYMFSMNFNFNAESSLEGTLLQDTNINANLILIPRNYLYYTTDLRNLDYIQINYAIVHDDNGLYNFLTGDDNTDEETLDLYFYAYSDRQVLSFLIRFNQPLENINSDFIDYISGVPSEYQYLITNYEQQTINQSTLDNTFEYAVNGLVDNNLYNWAQDTFAYTSINAMCTGLSVQNGVLPLLLSYWVIITAIYIVFDIIIFTFTKLTHLLQD